MEKELGKTFFRIKLSYNGEDGDTGAIVKKKEEYLAMSVNYTDAESLVCKIIQDRNFDVNDNVKYEIVKTKIDKVIFNDILNVDENKIMNLINYYFEESENTGVGLYNVKVIYFSIDADTGKKKSENSDYWIPASSSENAGNRMSKILDSAMMDYVIRDIKFDKAQEIYVTEQRYESDKKY